MTVLCPPNLEQTQKIFTAHLRDHSLTQSLPAGISAQGIDLYRELAFYTMEELISTTFPVLKIITPIDKWQAMIKDFFAVHVSSTPYFYEIAQEFLDYVQTERDTSNDPPYFYELAHYEWVEMALHIADIELPKAALTVDVEINRAILSRSPLAWVMQYQFPVHKISGDYQPFTSEQLSFLVVYRTSNEQVRFMELTALSAHLLTLFADNSHQTVSAVLKQLSIDACAENQPEFIAQATEHVRNFVTENILINVS